ncbi:MAG: hypothetical protein KVP17_003924 [Porospora cf. gigantea B]|uniref:uncharacterized protein n=1 Tax=Porospora cf. gigantea B TaxID=2853592 RepID=UPI003571B336|nr:MAG: hypothetical protein KVP17_003924 [Porospora cf. gigantea B]
MRVLKEAETRKVFEKLAKFMGDKLFSLLDRPDGKHCFRLVNQKVYYCREDLAKIASCVPKKNVVALGVLLGKFTKGDNFRLYATATDLLAQHGKHKVWLRQPGEQSFLYGNHVVKRHLGRVTEDTAQNQGVVVLNMNDIPLGFGVTAKSTADMRGALSEATVVIHQADTGEYLRSQNEMC